MANKAGAMNGKRVQKKTEWTAEDRERRRKVRELFKDKPTIDQLVASGELSGSTVPMGLYLELQQLLNDLKEARASKRLSLADLAERTCMDKAVLSSWRTASTAFRPFHRSPATPRPSACNSRFR